MPMSPITRESGPATIHPTSTERRNSYRAGRTQLSFSGACGKYTTYLRRTLEVAPIPYADELGKLLPAVVVATVTDAWGKLPHKFWALWEYFPTIFAKVWGEIPVWVERVSKKVPILLQGVWVKLPSQVTKEWESFPARFSRTWDKFPAIFSAVWLGEKPVLNCGLRRRLKGFQIQSVLSSSLLRF